MLSKDERCLFLKLFYFNFEKFFQLKTVKKGVSTHRRIMLMIDSAVEYLTAGYSVSQSTVSKLRTATMDSSKAVSIKRRIIPL